jgi:hypothetical protein
MRSCLIRLDGMFNGAALVPTTRSTGGLGVRFDPLRRQHSHSIRRRRTGLPRGRHCLSGSFVRVAAPLPMPRARRSPWTGGALYEILGRDEQHMQTDGVSESPPVAASFKHAIACKHRWRGAPNSGPEGGCRSLARWAPTRHLAKRHQSVRCLGERKKFFPAPHTRATGRYCHPARCAFHAPHASSSRRGAATVQVAFQNLAPQQSKEAGTREGERRRRPASSSFPRFPEAKMTNVLSDRRGEPE